MNDIWSSMVYGYVEGTYMQQDMSITQNKYFTWNNGKKSWQKTTTTGGGGLWEKTTAI